MTPEELAVLFHETYERLAPSFSYETRMETRKFDPTTPNGRLMIAVCGEISTALAEAESINVRLLAWIFRDVVWQGASHWWICRGCGKAAIDKLDVRHVPGCILWGHSRDELAALDAFEIKQGEAL